MKNKNSKIQNIKLKWINKLSELIKISTP
jgi:hypothetical protein